MASSSVRLHAGARSISRAPAIQAAESSSMDKLRATKLSMPCRQAVAGQTKKLVVQAKVKRKSEGFKGEASGLDASRMPWAAVAAATALVSLGASSDSAYADARTQAATSVAPIEAPPSETNPHIFGFASLSAPLLVSEENGSRDFEAALPLGVNQEAEIVLSYQAAEPLQHAFSPDDFRAKLPNGAGPLGGGEWSFSSHKTKNRSCPAWGGNPNIEMVVPGAAKALQPRPPGGTKRWFASYGGVDITQLQGGVEGTGNESEESAGVGGWEYLEVVEATEESGSQKEGESAPTGKNPFEGLIIEIVRMPVFSCFSL